MMPTIKELQTFLGVASDGIWGPKSQAALDAVLHPKPPVQTSGDLVDSRSEGNITTLYPKLRPIARQFISTLVSSGIDAKIISGTRTYDEQDSLYEQGRSKPGKIVTNARGGYSNHNFGIAFDIGIFEDGKYLDDSPRYTTAGKIGKSMGLSWGGDWKFSDPPHFELKPSWAAILTESEMIAELRNRTASNKDLFA